MFLRATTHNHPTWSIHVTPHMVTNSFQERGLPIWEFFCLHAVPARGLPPYGYGDWCFCLPLSHGCAGVPPKILAKKQKKSALPLRVTGIHKSPYRNGDSPFPYRDSNDINTRSNTGITRDYRMVTGIHKSPYGNGVSPFPYG